jgi:hypothetical protein
MMMAKEMIAAKREELYGIVDELLGVVSVSIEEQTPIHKVESTAWGKLLRAGHTIIQLLVDCLGNGDVGETRQLPDGRVLKRSEEVRLRPYISIFGPVHIERFVYAVREDQRIEFCEVDARLALPASKFSYLLQDWDQSFAMEQPFGRVVQTVKKILGLDQYVDSVERTNRNMAQEVEAFHASLETPPTEEEGEIFVQTADGKGVPIRRPADAPPIHRHRHDKGPKPDRKKMATLGAVYSVNRFVRTAEDVVESLFRDPREKRPKRKRPRPCHKRMRAVLNHTNAEGDEIDGRAALFGWISDEISQRNPDGSKPTVRIMDGEESLWSMSNAFQEDVPLIDVLDLLHVTPRLWKAASLFHARGSRKAEKFVRDRVLRILRGEVEGVVRGFRRMSTDRKFAGKKLSQLETICNYFEKHRHRMRYDEYLAQGYPIASGVIEGACRHVVKDRLERTGMNWVREGAQPMLDLRCIHLCDQWDQFMEFRFQRETQRLYPYRDTLEPTPWSVAA